MLLDLFISLVDKMGVQLIVTKKFMCNLKLKINLVIDLNYLEFS